MAGSFDFLHIKKRTAGSSNELSFDVLEHKSAVADGKAARDSKLPKAPKASQGSYQGVAGTTSASVKAEVEKRKKARRAHRLRIQAAGIAAIVALVALGIYTAVQVHEGQMNYSARVDALVERLSQADETMARVDAMMEDPFDPDEAEARRAELAKMPQLTTDLNRITLDAQSLAEVAPDDNTAVVVGQIGEASKARTGMLSAAGDAFRLSTEASEQVDRANRVWNDVVGADQAARGAISAANKATTQEATSSSLDMTRNASASFESALSELRDISTVYGADFSDQEAYLEKRIEALGKAAETSEALLAGDRDRAKDANEAYNVADQEAAALAAELPPSIAEIVQERFDATMEDPLARYSAARDSAVKTDAVIREYLGNK